MPKCSGHWIGGEWYPFDWMRADVAVIWDWLMKLHTGVLGRPLRRPPGYLIEEITHEPTTTDGD